MKVLMYNCTDKSGGFTVIKNLKEHVESYGFDVFLSVKDDLNFDGRRGIISKVFNKINRIINFKFGYDYELLPYQTNKLIEIIKRENPDIIHLHGLHSGGVNYKRLFEFLSYYKRPVVWTQHDCCAFTGKCAYYVINQCEKWQIECHNCQFLSSYPAYEKDRTRKNFINKVNIYNKLDENQFTLVSVSQWLNKQVEQSILSGFPHIVIENGVDVENVKFKESFIRSKFCLEDKFIVLCVASGWSERKGISDIFKLSNDIKNKIDNVQIVIIGCDDEQIKKCQELGIIALKRTSNLEELVEWYSTADVFFNPSMEETFGLVTVEAMACGTPIVGYDSTAFPELFCDGVGYCVNPHDIGTVIECFNTIKMNGRQFYADNCRTRVVSKFNSIKQYEKYIELYNDIKELR